jgi:GTP cyclohydrolase I
LWPIDGATDGRTDPANTQAIGEDPEREGLLKTPSRVAQSLTFLTRGYDMDPAKVINDALLRRLRRNDRPERTSIFIRFAKHHLLPFFGKAHVAYIPHHKIVGISKLAASSTIFARRLQVQERMTNQIAHHDHGKNSTPLASPWSWKPSIYACACAASRKTNSYVITSSLLGAFRTRTETRNEFMNLIRRNRLTRQSKITMNAKLS